MQTIEYRYLHDPMVNNLVNYLENVIHELKFTPSEIRDCAMLAAIHYEQNRPPRRMFTFGDNDPTTAAIGNAPPPTALPIAADVVKHGVKGINL